MSTCLEGDKQVSTRGLRSIVERKRKATDSYSGQKNMLRSEHRDTELNKARLLQYTYLDAWLGEK